MNWLDIVIVVIVAGTVFLGLRIGLIRAALSIIGVVAGVILAGRYYTAFAKQLAFIPQPSAAQAVAFAIILV